MIGMKNLSSNNRFKCRFGCLDTFRSEAGRNYHQEKMHCVWTTPTTGTGSQVHKLSHVFDWTRTVFNQMNVIHDRINVDYCFECVK